MVEVSSDAPCHWTHRHNRHEWTPLIHEPDNPQVMWLGDKIWCPGKDDEGRPLDG